QLRRYITCPLRRCPKSHLWHLPERVRKIRGRFARVVGVTSMVGSGVQSLVRASALIAMIACGSLAASTASAQDQALKGDAHHGKAISYTCLGCHGVEGYKNAYPNYSVPRLEGQNPEYLSAALHGYKSGDRSHITMHSQASTLSDQDIADIAAYFSGKPLVSEHKPVG